MDCREFRELLGDEVDGRLAPADSARLAVHVASCAACADERRELASLRATFRAMPRPSVPAEFRAQVMERLPRGRVIPFPRALGWIAAVAAVAVVAVTLMNQGALGPEREVAKAVPAARRGAYDASGDGEATLESGVQDAQPPAAQVAREADDDLEESRKKQAAAGEKDEFEAKDRNVAREEAPAAPAATPKPTESPAPPVADAGAEKEKRTPPAEPELKADKAARAQSEDVRYVVFRDEAAALKFAASLRVTAEDAAKSKAAEPAAEAAPVRREIADATRVKTEDADRENADLLAQSSFTQRRVVARETVAPSVSEKDLAAALAAAGGQSVPVEDAARFRELLDETTDGTAAADGMLGGASTGGGADAGGGATGATSSTGGAVGGRGKAETARADEKRAGETPRVIVIVVLGPAPQPPAEKR